MQWQGKTFVLTFLVAQKAKETENTIEEIKVQHRQVERGEESPAKKLSGGCQDVLLLLNMYDLTMF